jgi:putrescine transport system ATP-binding protein
LERSAGRAPAEPWNDPAATPFIRLRGVTRTFGGVTAVDQVSLDIHRGEFFSLLGPSGCGKTTLLRMLAGFEAPDAGTVEIDGQDMSAVPPHRRPVNMMFQSYALFPHMTVAGNIGFGLRQARMPRPDIAARVQEMLQLVQLEGMGERKPHQLSGGQRQRVALARALALRPKLLLLDEPLGALDKRLRDQTQFELMAIQERLGITFVIVTHDQEEAMTMSSRIAVMRAGRIEQVAPPHDVYEFPNSRYVATFIGDANTFEARLDSVAADSARLASAETGGALLVDRSIDAAAGATVWVAVRPEKIGISTTLPEGAPENGVAGTVYDIGYLGDMSIYHVRLDNGRTVRAAQANMRRIADRTIAWNDRVWLSWHASAAVVLLK